MVSKMKDDLIRTNSGKTYKSFRALHIAMGMAVRNALLKFYKDVKKYAIGEIEKLYEKYQFK